MRGAVLPVSKTCHTHGAIEQIQRGTLVVALRLQSRVLDEAGAVLQGPSLVHRAMLKVSQFSTPFLDASIALL